MTAPPPDFAVVSRHLALLGGRLATAPDLQVEIAWGLPEAGPRNARLFRIAELDEAAAFAARANQGASNVYVGTTIKSADCPSNRRSSAKDAVLGTCLAIDIDAKLVAGARQLPRGVKPQLLALSGRRPTLRGHLWISLQPTSDLDMLEEISGRAIERCGGDMAARGRGALMRLAGTVSFPSQKKKQRGYCIEEVIGHFVNAPTYNLAALASVFPAKPIGCAPWIQSPVNHRTLSPFPSEDIQRVQAALDSLPAIYADTYDLWIRVGLALHAFDPSVRGLLLWRQFSERCREKAAVTDFEYRWATFGRRNTGRQITVRWLFAEARKHGWQQTYQSSLRQMRRG